ncbi:hypothetical protein [Paenibacillus eucommiae]|uniref:Uncharacterized protein n=1 Tax=Paenibacillus eucommiae TaxID=1355755 RepID=A0ABS4IRU9_9BACL|nr:hypothetical protein [Paenibacillus eucommiae]MBP1990304.1 hypothetical protein [Paenibacillus eucommiae]
MQKRTSEMEKESRVRAFFQALKLDETLNRIIKTPASLTLAELLLHSSYPICEQQAALDMADVMNHLLRGMGDWRTSDDVMDFIIEGGTTEVFIQSLPMRQRSQEGVRDESCL